jgi:histidine triad (HIT) family protein
MQDCIFCQIVSKKIPVKIVYEDGFSLAFLDINPINSGHTLVIPKEHFETILETPEENLSKLIQAVKAVAESVNKSLNPDGMNVEQNNKEIAGQAVPHIHFHVVPRFKDDGLVSFTNSPRKKLEEKELEEIAGKIKANIKVLEPEKKEEDEEVEDEKPEMSDEDAYWIKRDLEIG